MMDNRFANQQSGGMTFQHHNVMPHWNIIRVFDHAVCMDGITGFINRLILLMAITLGIRPKAMAELTVDLFIYNEIDGKKKLFLRRL